MKNIMIILLVFISICANAQEYKSMFPDGRKWVCVGMRPDGEIEPDSYYSISVIGDTVIENIQCKKIQCIYPKRTVYEAVYEQDGKVYKWDIYTNRGFYVLMDFNMHVGDTYKVEDDGSEFEEEVLEEDSIEVLGVKYRRLRMKSFSSEPFYWVEGIGSNTADAWFQISPTSDGYIGHLYKCYDNGKLVFRMEDFNSPSVCGIGNVLDRQNEEGKIYGVNGMRVDKPEKGCVYIKNGRKYVSR